MYTHLAEGERVTGVFNLLTLLHDHYLHMCWATFIAIVRHVCPEGHRPDMS